MSQFVDIVDLAKDIFQPPLFYLMEFFFMKNKKKKKMKEVDHEVKFG